jgi:GNAT superfamily N-acetyltransferase
MTMRIVPETNASLLMSLGCKTFDQAFREMNDPTYFSTYLAHAFSLETVTGELKDTRSEFFVAYQGDEPVGYFKLFAGTAPQCVTPFPAIELARLYALQTHWGKGIGPAMMAQALAVAHEKGFATVWLSSWKKNHRGNAFYQKWGFDRVGEKTFDVGGDVQEDFVLCRLL